MALQSICLRLNILCLLGVIGTGTLAQSDDIEMEEIIVVGTRIPRFDFVSPSPVYTIFQDEMQLNGAATLAEYLNRFP